MRSSERMTAARAGELILRSRLPQTLLLTGEAGSGKRALAEHLAAALLCTGQAPRPCGVCRSCRKVRQGLHPDLTIVDEGDDELKVDLARSLRRAAAVVPNDGERRVTVLCHAQRLNPAAQNALLKTLEEPPTYAFFILTAEQPDALLPTVRSRCTRYELAPPAEETEAHENLLPPYLQALAAGREDRLLAACMSMEKLPRAAQGAFLQLLRTALRDAAFAALGLGGRLLPRERAQTEALGRAVPPDKLLRLAAFLNTLETRAQGNAAAAALSTALCAGSYAICYEKMNPGRGK